MTEKMIKFVLGHLSKKEAGEFIRSMDENPALRDECADLYNKVAVANMAPRDGDAQYAAEKLAELNRTSRMAELPQVDRSPPGVSIGVLRRRPPPSSSR